MGSDLNNFLHYKIISEPPRSRSFQIFYTTSNKVLPYPSMIMNHSEYREKKPNKCCKIAAVAVVVIMLISVPVYCVNPGLLKAVFPILCGYESMGGQFIL